MKAKRIRLAVGILIVLIVAVGVYWQSIPIGGHTASPGHPVVFYDESGKPSEATPALTKPEIKRIIGLVATQTHDPVWLIRANPARIYTAYVVPDETTSRIRVGRAYSMRKSDGQMSISPSWEYVQVSLPSHSLDAKLRKPSVAEMPFEWPQVVDPDSGESAPLPKEDVADIVDFIRQQASSSQMLSITWNTQEMPILSISRKGDIIHVKLGYMHDFLWGHGVTIEIKAGPGGYTASRWNPWIS